MVDAAEGPMPQTRFVLRKALALGLKPIVIINKMDKPHTNPSGVVDDVFDLFMKLGATDEQLDFPILYASGREGWASLVMEEKGKDIEPVFTTILSHIPPPLANAEKPLQMQITMLDYNNFLGHVGIGRILNGTLKKGQQVALANPKETKISKAVRIDKFLGLVNRKLKKPKPAISSSIRLEGVEVGDTVCGIYDVVPLPRFP